MATQQISSKWMAFLVVSVAVVYLMNYQQVNSASVDTISSSSNYQEEDDETIEVSGSSNDQDAAMMVPYVAECGPDEENQVGKHPSCEPTCANPKPFCIKIFYQSLDYVPCFCKAPLVRDTQSKRCVQVSECPKSQSSPSRRPSKST